MLERMYGPGKIETAGRSAPTLTTGLGPDPIQPEGALAFMMPWAGRAMLRATISRVTTATPRGER